jgi:hypothetical protein
MKKGAITFFEMILITILTVVLAIAYNLIAQRAVQDVLLRVIGGEEIRECNYILFSIYKNDYVRWKPDQKEFEGSYEDLQDFYGGPEFFPIKYWYEGRIALAGHYERLMIAEGEVGGICTIRTLDPYEMIEEGRTWGRPITLEAVE